MRSLIITFLLFIFVTINSSGQPAQDTFTQDEQAIIELSNTKWQWMENKEVEKLSTLFHENAQFVHMGGYWGKQEELDIIRTGSIWYKKAEIHNVKVKFATNIATIYSQIHLNSVVGGNSVRFPFIVTEVFIKEKGQWQLFSLVFTRLLGE
ncbi:MAG: nuclear transport factor 2 family protein [Bacteroidales bacterium]